MIPRLERGESIKRAYLGVSTSGGTGGVTVAAVTAGAPAATAGLQVGDVIKSVGGKEVAEPDDVAAAIQDRRPGETRRGRGHAAAASEQTVDVTLGERPASATP